jgi:hypothetical protein
MSTGKTTRLFGYLIFLIGVLLALAFSGLALWVNLEGLAFWGYPESISYDPDLTTYAEISGLKCPVLLTDGEKGVMRITVTNPNEFTITTHMAAHISKLGEDENMLRRARTATLLPGEETEFRWQITTDNTIFDHMILGRVFLRLTSGHSPSRTKSCGTISLNLWGLESKQLLILVTSLSIGLILLGALILWRSYAREKTPKKLAFRISLVIGLLSILSLVSSLLSSWLFILISLALIPIIIFSGFSYHVGRMEGKFN